MLIAGYWDIELYLEKTECKGKVNPDLSSNWELIGSSSSEQQTLCRVDLGPKVVPILLKTLSGSTCGNPEIHGDEMLLNVSRSSNFWADIISGNCLEFTVSHSLLSTTIALNNLEFAISTQEIYKVCTPIVW